jgi:excisionase family DNA binding protein
MDSREAAALLRIHHKTLERKARGSVIPGYQIAGRWYFRASELDAWLRSQLRSASANLVRVEIQFDHISPAKKPAQNLI